MAHFDLNDVHKIEGEVETDELGYFTSIQRAVNSGMWSLQGSYGRTMMAAIEDGRVMLGPNAAHDYYGNRIPSRTEVQDGTKGSRAFVAFSFGEEWAKKMESV